MMAGVLAYGIEPWVSGALYMQLNDLSRLFGAVLTILEF